VTILVPNGEKGRVVDVRVYPGTGDELPPGANMVAGVCSTEAQNQVGDKCEME